MVGKGKRERVTLNSGEDPFSAVSLPSGQMESLGSQGLWSSTAANTIAA